MRWDQWGQMILCWKGATSFSMIKMEKCFLMESKVGRLTNSSDRVVGCGLPSGKQDELIFKLECCTESDN